MDKAIITCAVTGVLTDPKQHPVPVTIEQMAASSREAYDAGAAIVHLHFRRQEPGLGHLPTWDPEVCAAIVDAVRSACPGIIINMSTGVIGPDIGEPVAAMKRLRPEIAACNAGTLNYLKTKSDGSWAWPPMIFDNPVAKVQAFLAVMREVGAMPEFECFDTGIVRSVGLYVENKMAARPPATSSWAWPRAWPRIHGCCRCWSTGCRRVPAGRSPRSVARTCGRCTSARPSGGALRTGLEDTFYLPDGSRAARRRRGAHRGHRRVRRAGRARHRESGRGPRGVGPARSWLIASRSRRRGGNFRPRRDTVLAWQRCAEG
ncbi:MAG: 3-keto-5-aminohexanoate cleavage protein [Nannocystaceae bacterium]